MRQCHFAVVNTRQVRREGVCGRFDADGHRRNTHTHAASTEDEHIVLTLIKDGKMCCLEKIVCACLCVLAIYRGS